MGIQFSFQNVALHEKIMLNYAANIITRNYNNNQQKGDDDDYCDLLENENINSNSNTIIFCKFVIIELSRIAVQQLMQCSSVDDNNNICCAHIECGHKCTSGGDDFQRPFTIHMTAAEETENEEEEDEDSPPQQRRKTNERRRSIRSIISAPL